MNLRASTTPARAGRYTTTATGGFPPVPRRALPKKVRERLLVEQEFRPWYGGRPRGEIVEDESPDFLVRDGSGHTVGIEVTECYRGVCPGRGSVHKEQESLRRAFERESEKTYYGAYKRPVHVLFAWADLPATSRPLSPKLVAELASRAADDIGGVLPAAPSERAEVGGERLAVTGLDGILESISVRPSGYVDDNGWGSPWGYQGAAYSPAALGIAELDEAINRKEATVPLCRENCDEVWLLVAVTGGPSSFDYVEDAALEHAFRSGFDRVMLVCLGSNPNHRVLTLVGPNKDGRS